MTYLTARDITRLQELGWQPDPNSTATLEVQRILLKFARGGGLTREELTLVLTHRGFLWTDEQGVLRAAGDIPQGYDHGGHTEQGGTHQGVGTGGGSTHHPSTMGTGHMTTVDEDLSCSVCGGQHAEFDCPSIPSPNKGLQDWLDVRCPRCAAAAKMRATTGDTTNQP
jgi:hypothetical protein